MIIVDVYTVFGNFYPLLAVVHPLALYMVYGNGFDVVAHIVSVFRSSV